MSNRWTEFPRPTPSNLEVVFYRLRELAGGTIGAAQLTKMPHRFPSELMKLKSELDILKEEDGAVAKLWVESEYPHFQWSRGGVVAILPQVEVSPAVWDIDTVKNCWAAVNEHAELGFISPSQQECWEEIDFDHPATAEFKRQAKLANWNLIEPMHHSRRNPVASYIAEAGECRGDDGIFDQYTHAFYVGPRCGWCGSSAILPNNPNVCYSCEAEGDAIESRAGLNMGSVDLS